MREVRIEDLREPQRNADEQAFYEFALGMKVDLDPDDVVATYAGLRPLLQGRASSTAELSRSHAVTQLLPGLVAVAGGKFTTYRVMAADAVDLALSGEPGAPTSRSKQVPLAGAVDFAATAGSLRVLAGRLGLDADTSARLQHRYGGLLGELLDLVVADPSLGLAIPGAPSHLLAEARYAVSYEGALHIADVLERRTRVAIEYRDHGAASAEAVARIIAPLLGWTPAERKAEVAAYRARVGDATTDAVVEEEDDSRR